MGRQTGRYIGAAILFYAAYVTGNVQWAQAGVALLSSAVGSEKQRRARNRARNAYNASLQDRMIMLDLQADAPRTLALGRVRAVEGVRRRFANGEHNENLTLIVSFAGHEIDGFERFWFNDMPLQLDGSGYVTRPASLTGCSAVRDGTTATLTKTSHGLIDGSKAIISGFNLAEFNGTYEIRNATANTFQYTIPNVIGGNPSGSTGVVEVRTPYKKYENETKYQTGTLNGTGEASITLSFEPVGLVQCFWSQGTGDSQTSGQCTITQDSGLDYDITGGLAGADYFVNYQTAVGESFVRIRTYLGTAAQTVGADLAAEYPGQLLETDDFAGIALAVIDLAYNEDAFPQGVPNITATFRGAKCLDPRTSIEAWTENPAVHAYHYARWDNGWAVPDAEIRSQDFEDAADLCDVSTDFTLGDDDVTLERYRCGIVISSDSDPRQVMGDIMETMAGRWGWAGGTLRMRCGAMAAPAWTLDESWIAQPLGQGGQPTGGQPVVRISNGIPREERVNHVSGTCIDQEQRFQALPYPAVRDDALITADGAEYRVESDLPGISHIAHAQHLASIMIREAQAPLRMEILSNLNAYPLELFDVGEVTLSRYGMAAKTMEVIGWRWRPTEGVSLRLSEITEAMYETVDELNGRDPAPNGDLPSPWYVEQIENVEVTSAPDDLIDASIITRTRVTWDAPVSQAILAGGKIEVQYTRADTVPADGVDWASWREQGSSVEAVIPGLMAGSFYLFRVRAINSLSVRGPWSDQVLHQIAMPPGTGTIVLTCTPFPFFSFANGTTHTAQAPGNETLTLTARLIGIPGTATITAEAFTARTGGTSLGAVTLGGSGNVRTMTAAQFVAPGSSGSVRRVVVTARKGVITPDFLTVYRQDSTTTDPFLFLDNPTHTVSTDTAGDNGDYSGAVTAVRVYAGLTDLTADYSTAISADTGLTATINGGAGPVTGVGDLSVAVTDSTISDGIVLITATDSPSVLTAEFRVIKQLASGTGYNAYFDPAEILLPVNSDGEVSSFSGATSEFFIVLGSGLDDTTNWSLSKEDIGVTSTLTGSTVAIAAFTPLGTLGDLTTTEIPLATGWDSASSATWCDDVWVVFGSAAGTYSTVLRSADLETFAEVSGLTAGNWTHGTYGAGKLVVIETDVASDDRVLRSADKGLTFTLDTLSQNGVWGHVHFGDGFLVAAETSTAGSWSADADTWANRTMPASGCSLAYAAPAWAAVSPAGALYISDDSAVTWSASLNSSMSLPGGNVVARAVGYRGAIVCALLNSTNRIVYTIDSGATFVTVILPGTYSEPRLLMAVQNVLYLVSDDLTVYSTPDGLTWTESADPFGATALADGIYGLADSAPIDYIPAIASGVVSPPTLVGSIVDNQASIAVPTHSAGDMIVVIDRSGTVSSTPATLSGFTSLATTAPAFGYGSRAQYAIDAGNTITTIANSGSPVHTMAVLVFSGCSGIGDVQVYDPNTANTSGTFPALTLDVADGSSLAMAVLIANQSHATRPTDPTDMTVELDAQAYGGGDFMTWLSDAGVTSFTGKSTTWTTNAYWITYSIELLADGGGAGDSAYKQALSATSGETGFVRMTGTKSGELDIVRSLPVRKATPPAPVYTSQASPAYLILPATSDGVVTSYANATITAKIMRNNVDDSSNWSWTWTATYMTPSSGSTNVATFTAMDNAQDAAIVTFVAEKPGEPLITGGIDVVKQFSTEGSGPRVGAVFNAFSATGTWIGLKFLSTGVYQVKVGSGGTYVDYGQWAGVVSASNGALYWLRVETSGHALTSGTTGSWLAMTSDREYVLSDATSGTHTTSLTVMFADSSGGANAILSYGSLQLLVP